MIIIGTDNIIIVHSERAIYDINARVEAQERISRESENNIIVSIFYKLTMVSQLASWFQRFHTPNLHGKHHWHNVILFH